MKFLFKCLFVFFFAIQHFFSQENSLVKIGRLKYNGGGDWYNDPSCEVNLLNFVKVNTLINVEAKYQFVEASSDKIFSYPILFMTGHGNVKFSDFEIEKLRTYLTNGGFLYVDDDYGMDKSFREEIKKIFPENQLVEIPYSYGLFHCHFDFKNGVPKTHEHDEKNPQTFGILHNGRLVVLYTYETNPSDGWADTEIHNDTKEIREEALKFGTNIIVWVLTN